MMPVQNHYIPSVELARDRYGLQQTVNLEEGIRRTAVCVGWTA